MRDFLLGIGACAGAVLMALGGLVYFGFRADNSDADALAAAVRLFIGIPCLVVGTPLLALCLWALLK